MDVVVVEAVRTPTGKRDGALSSVHPLELLASVQKEVLARVDLDPATVGQVVGGCVGQIGAQSMNITRNVWLTAGLPITTAASTVDAQCGSSQQAFNLAFSMLRAGLIDTAVACGVEVMSRVPMGSTTPKDPFVGKPITREYWKHHEYTSQFEGADRIAESRGISREQCDRFAKLSQDRAALAWSNDRFKEQILEVPVADLDGDGAPAGTMHTVSRDEGVRATTLEGLADLKPTGRADGVHTAGSSSQIADGASAVLLMHRTKAESLGLEPMAEVVDACLVGCDPVLMLEGPIPATQRLLSNNGLSIDDIDLVEINEAFASVVLAWQIALDADMDRVNPNGGAIAIGHPLGATGAMLVTKAVHELRRTDRTHAIVTMCCGGGLGTGTLLRRS